MLEDFQDYSDLLLKDIDNAVTLEELGISTLNYMIHSKGIDKRYITALAMRVTWVHGTNSTLDEAGKALGVTRERVRQVEVKLKPLHLELIVAPKLVYKVIGILGKVNTWEEFMSIATEEKISINIENWSIESMKDLIQIFVVPKVSQQFAELISKIEPLLIVKETSNVVRGFRNALGLIDIQALSRALNETPSKCTELLKLMYPYVLISNNLAMANVRQGGSITNILLKQLSIASPLKPATLVEGIERASAYRRTPMVGSQEDLENLVIQICKPLPAGYGPRTETPKRRRGIVFRLIFAGT
jgi:hypothetical protein